MASINKVVLVGNLGADPESRTLAGDLVCNLRIATSDKWKDKTTGSPVKQPNGIGSFYSAASHRSPAGISRRATQSMSRESSAPKMARQQRPRPLHDRDRGNRVQDAGRTAAGIGFT